MQNGQTHTLLSCPVLTGPSRRPDTPLLTDGGSSHPQNAGARMFGSPMNGSAIDILRNAALFSKFMGSRLLANIPTSQSARPARAGRGWDGGVSAADPATSNRCVHGKVPDSEPRASPYPPRPRHTTRRAADPIGWDLRKTIFDNRNLALVGTQYDSSIAEIASMFASLQALSQNVPHKSKKDYTGRGGSFTECLRQRSSVQMPAIPDCHCRTGIPIMR